jgi:hypothetical protein
MKEQLASQEMPFTTNIFTKPQNVKIIDALRQSIIISMNPDENLNPREAKIQSFDCYLE